MNATSISNCVDQVPRHSTATATAIHFGRPFVIKNLKFKIKNSTPLREITRFNANYRLTIRHADSPLKPGSVPRNSVKFRKFPFNHSACKWPVAACHPPEASNGLWQLATLKQFIMISNDL